MQDSDLIQQCEQLVLLRHEIKELRKLEKELTRSIKDTFGERGIVRDEDGRRVCKIASRRNPKMGIRLKFFDAWARDTLSRNGII